MSFSLCSLPMNHVPALLKPFIVEVAGVLRRQDHTQAESACLLEQTQDRLFGRRVARVGREVAEHLVNVEQRAQAGRAAERAHPAEHVFQQQRDDELAFALAEVGDVEDRHAGASVRLVEQALDVHRVAFQPRLERRRGDDVVQVERQLLPLALGDVIVDREDAELVEGRLLHLQDDVLKRQILPALPGVLENVGDEHVLFVLHRLYVAPDQRQQRRDDAVDLLTVGFHVGIPAALRRAQRGEDAHGQPGIRAGRVDAVARGGFEPAHPVGDDAPTGESLRPGVRHVGGVLRHVHPGAARVVHVDPGLKVFGAQVGEVEQQIGDVALRIDDDRRDVVENGFFEQGDAQPGFAAAGHADDDGVGGQVARVVIDHVVGKALAVGVVATTEIKRGGRFDKRHEVLLHRVGRKDVSHAALELNRIRLTPVVQPQETATAPTDCLRGRQSKRCAAPTPGRLAA